MIANEKIRHIRIFKGWKPAQLVAKTGLSSAEISRLESKNRHPNTDTLQRIAAAFEVSVSFLLNEEDEDFELPVALRRQTLKKALKEVPVADSQRLRFEEMCFKDSAPCSVVDWKNFIENLAFCDPNVSL